MTSHIKRKCSEESFQLLSVIRSGLGEYVWNNLSRPPSDMAFVNTIAYGSALATHSMARFQLITKFTNSENENKKGSRSWFTHLLMYGRRRARLCPILPKNLLRKMIYLFDWKLCVLIRSWQWKYWPKPQSLQYKSRKRARKRFFPSSSKCPTSKCLINLSAILYLERTAHTNLSTGSAGTHAAFHSTTSFSIKCARQTQNKYGSIKSGNNKI